MQAFIWCTDHSIFLLSCYNDIIKEMRGCGHMRILIALDSFKGALSSIEAGKAAAEGVKTSMDAICEVCAVGDGGEGSVDALAMAISNGNWKAYEVMDAFHQTITIKVLHFDDTGIPTAAVEAAQIFGLHHHKGTPQTIQTTSTYGLGMLIKQLKEEGLKLSLIHI